jgi:hypothetical protein
MRGKCVGQDGCAWWLAQHPEIAHAKRSLQDFIAVGWAARFRGSPSTTLVYGAIIRIEQVRKLPPGSPIFASLAELAWAGGVGTRKTVRRSLQRLQKAGLIEYLAGKRGVGIATEVKRALPIPLPDEP